MAVLILAVTYAITVLIHTIVFRLARGEATP
jgi:hypothetical protein